MAPNTESNQALEQTRNKLAAWRQRNKAPKPIPGEIWTAAVELSQQLGLGPVSRELGLDYGSLKRRAAEPARQPMQFFEFMAEPAVGLLESCVLQVQSDRCQANVQLHQVSPQALGAVLREVLY
ncbi:hypothetical protein JST97_29535 [bacterium]|nr:hypothetical protein [bacterium]